MGWERFFKGLIIAILGYFVILALIFAANASVFTFVTSDQNKVKQIVAGSGIYDDAAGAFLDHFTEPKIKSGSERAKTIGELPIENKEVRSLIKQSFDPEFVKASSEIFLSGVYGWLEGKTKEPEFSISLAEPKKELINRLADYSFKRAAKLPPCTYEQLAGSTFDVFNAPCAPPGLSKAQIRSEIQHQINSDKDSLLAKNAVTAADFKDQNGDSVFANLAGAPNAFKTARWLPWFLIFLAVLAAYAIVFVSDARWRGIRRVGILLLASAVIVALIPALVGSVLDNLLTAPSQTPLSKDIFFPLLDTFNQATAKVYYVFAAITAVTGGALFAVSPRLKNKASRED